MKKLVLKFLALALAIALPLMVANTLYLQTNFWLTNNERYRIVDHPDDIELLNLGNSHEYAALRWGDLFDGTAHNFALSSQSPRYGLSVLKDKERFLSPGAVVLIPVSFFDFETDFDELYNEFPAYDTRYYSLLSNKFNIVNYSLEKDLLYNYLPALTAKENLKHIWDDIELPTSYYVEDPRTVGGGIGLAEVATRKASDWENHVMVPAEDGSAVDRVTEENRRWIEATIAYCLEKGYKPVLLSSPVTDALTSRLSPDRIERFDGAMAAIQEAYPEVPWLDYSRDERFVASYDLFRDSDHLNSAGGDRYTKQVLEDLANLGLIQTERLIFLGQSE